MARFEESSVGELRADAERRRVELAETVGQLRSKVSESLDRVSPEAVKAEIKDYVRSRGEMLVEKARQNPLQAAAIGIGLGYPLWGIARSIPAPILMMGAGLFLMGSAPGQRISRQVADAAADFGERISEGAEVAGARAHDARDAVAESFDTARAGLASALTNVREQAGAASQTAADVAQRAKETALGYQERAIGAAAETADALLRKSAASSQASSGAVRDAITAARDMGSDAVVRVRDQTVASSQSMRTALNDGIQQNPLIVGAVGLAIGAVIANLLPRSDVERSVLGDISSGVQKRAADLAEQGFDAAKGVLSEALDGASARVSSESLTPGDLQEATRDLGRRVRKVAENATTTAIELATKPNNAI